MTLPAVAVFVVLLEPERDVRVFIPYMWIGG
jgi:hypothetical protein